MAGSGEVAELAYELCAIQVLRLAWRVRALLLRENSSLTCGSSDDEDAIDV